VTDRGAQLASACQAEHLDAFLVTDPSDLRWLTGFTGSTAIALCGEQFRFFVSDFRYEEQAGDEVGSDFERLTCRSELHDVLVETITSTGLTIGCDRAQVSVGWFEKIGRELSGKAQLVAVEGLVSKLRELKSDQEVARIEAACELADAVFLDVLNDGLEGKTEKDVAWALERGVRERGGEGMSFEPIVAAGPHGALPHAQPRDVVIPKDTLVVIDWGAKLDGYCSDCTRTVATGEIDDEMTAAYGSVLAAQRLSCDGLRAGLTGKEVDQIARDRLAIDGLAELFGHGLGHGVGLEVHEGPRVSKAGTDELRPRMVVTIEPGVYLEGKFGIRIEDLLVIEEEGSRSLTTVQRELIVVG